MDTFKHTAAQVKECASIAGRVFRRAAGRVQLTSNENAMNGLDYAVVVVCAIGAIHGLRRGALRMVTSVVSLLAAVYFASIYYARAGAIAEAQLGARPAVGAVIGYVVVFALIFVAVEIVGSMAVNLLHLIHLTALDRLAGGLLGSGIAAVFAGIAIILMSSVMPADSPLLRDSQMMPMLLAYNEMLVNYIPGEAKVGYERSRDDLMKYWVENAMKARGYAASPAASPSPSAKK
jgi:membrane protein required for colicin V production